MAGFARVKITGLNRTNRILRQLGKDGPKILGSALFQVGEEIIGESKKNFVPVDLGILRNSGFVENPKVTSAAVSVELGFGGPAGKGNVGNNSNKERVGYALIVHENPRAGKTGGISPQGKRYQTWAKVGGWKYLEKPFKKAQKNMDDRIAFLLKKAEPRFR